MFLLTKVMHSIEFVKMLIQTFMILDETSHVYKFKIWSIFATKCFITMTKKFIGRFMGWALFVIGACDYGYSSA